MHLLDLCRVPPTPDHVVVEFGGVRGSRKPGAGNMAQRVEEEVVDALGEVEKNPGSSCSQREKAEDGFC